MPLPLSIAILTKNEEARLPRCLASVAGLGREIIVLDSGSTDRTEAIARAAEAVFIHQDWLGFPAQRSASFAHCTQPWILALDADEALSPALRAEILDFFSPENSRGAQVADGASFPRKVWFLGRWITHGDWYPDRKLRLVRRDKVRCEGAAGHDALRLTESGRECRLHSDLHHFSFPDLNTYLQKIAVFGDEHLKRERAAGRRWSLWGTLFRPWWRFVRGYFFKRGFLDGFPGFWIATGIAFQTFVRYSRLYEHEAISRAPDTSNPAGIRQASAEATKPLT